MYKRVRPALSAKRQELRRLQYKNITERDIWDYLSKEKWSKAKNLMLSDIVSDILHADNHCLNHFVTERS